MKSFVCLVLALILVQSEARAIAKENSTEKPEEDPVKQGKKLVYNCAGSNNLWSRSSPPDVFANPDLVSDDEDVKHFTICVLVEAGIIKEDGKLDPELADGFIYGGIVSRVRTLQDMLRVQKKCRTVDEETVEKTAVEFIKCIVREASV